MCLIAFCFDPAGSQPITLAANRDEFFSRPTHEPGWWPDHPGTFGGRDAQAGGTWMAVSLPPITDQPGTRSCRFAALTNVRGGANLHGQPTSRGHLVTRTLQAPESTHATLLEIAAESDRYDGFNLLAFEWTENAERTLSQVQGWHLSNQGRLRQQVLPIEPGVHAVSNGAFDEDWPKASLLANAMRQALMTPSAQNADQVLLAALQTTEPAATDTLPDTGIGATAERELSMPFIRARFDPSEQRSTYGTRTSTLFNLASTGACRFRQISWDGESIEPKATDTREMRSV
ncbi:MAG: NRDE family protein [Burkholderiaceae bacterium]